jgi:fucose permease
MVVGGFICDLLGMKRIMLLACLCHLVGVCGTIWAPHYAPPDLNISFWWLWISAFIMGCGNGMVETGINPLAASLYPDKKTHILNILHAWWPGGLIIGGLSVLFLRKGIDLGFVEITGIDMKTGAFENWQICLFLILIPSIVYGLMVLLQPFPDTERVAAGISYGTMFKEAFRPLFLILAFCMLLTASTELGPQKWQASVMERTAQVSGTLILVYTSGMMFILRHFAGALVHRASPVLLLLVSSILSAVGLYLLSTAKDATTAFTYATIFGLGIAYFWPTMLGVTAERFPKGGALLLCLMGSFGNLAISQVLPIMGKIYDKHSVEELQRHDKDQTLTRSVVREDAINQDVKKKIDLLSPPTSEEVAAAGDAKDLLEEVRKNAFTPDQRDKLATWLKEQGAASAAEKLPKLTEANPPALSTREVKAIRAGMAELKGSLTQAQQDVLTKRSTIDSAEAFGAAESFRQVSILPVILIFIFGGIYLYDRSRGGYKVESIQGH